MLDRDSLLIHIQLRAKIDRMGESTVILNESGRINGLHTKGIWEPQPLLHYLPTPCCVSPHLTSRTRSWGGGEHFKQKVSMTGEDSAPSTPMYSFDFFLKNPTSCF